MQTRYWKCYLLKEFKIKADLEFYAYKLLPLLNNTGNMVARELTSLINAAAEEWNNRYLSVTGNGSKHTRLTATHTFEMGNKIIINGKDETPVIIIRAVG